MTWASATEYEIKLKRSKRLSAVCVLFLAVGMSVSFLCAYYETTYPFTIPDTNTEHFIVLMKPVMIYIVTIPIFATLIVSGYALGMMSAKKSLERSSS